MKTIEELRAEVEAMRLVLEKKGQELYGSVTRMASRSQQAEYESMRATYRDLKFKLSLLEEKEEAKLAKIEKARIKAELKLNPPPKVKKEKAVKVKVEKIETVLDTATEDKAKEIAPKVTKAVTPAKPKKVSKPRPMFASAHIYDKPKPKKVTDKAKAKKAEAKKPRPMFAAAYSKEKPTVKKATLKKTTDSKVKVAKTKTTKKVAKTK